MLWNPRAHVRKSLLLVATLAVAVSACGGGSSAATSAPAGGGSNSKAPGGGGGTATLADAGKNLQNINSYKFKMEMAGGDWASLLSMFNTGGGDSFVVTGTVIVKPKPAVEMDFGDTMKAIEVDGKSYTYVMGMWTEDKTGSSSMADSMSPEKLFAGYSSFGWKSAGSETKNGVATTHYTVSANEIAKEASLLGVKGDADWTCEAWVSKDGGYIVSMALTAKQNGAFAFKYMLDITDINSASNKVEAPTVTE